MNTNLSPRHLRLRDMLLRRWKTNGVKIGDKIESQNQIIKFCGFSLITVIKTLKDLEADGIIRRQVGKGSYLTKSPWSVTHWRIGFYYNRDIVGGGIFNNRFYTKLVVAFEKAVISDGHELVLGSFTHTAMPTAMWDALDAVILVGITDQTNLDQIENSSSQVSLFDLMLDELPLHSYRMDLAPAFDAMFQHYAGQNKKFLYLDSKIASSEQAKRSAAFQGAYRAYGNGADLMTMSVDQENQHASSAEFEATIAEFEPDIICGYMHRTWRQLAIDKSAKSINVYRCELDSTGPGFVVDTSGWMKQVLPQIYDHLDDRKAAPAHHAYPANFVP